MKHNIIGLLLAVLIILYACLIVEPLPAQEPVLTEQSCLQLTKIGYDNVLEGEKALVEETDYSFDHIAEQYLRSLETVSTMSDSMLQDCDPVLYHLILQILYDQQSIWSLAVLKVSDVPIDQKLLDIIGQQYSEHWNMLVEYQTNP